MGAFSDESHSVAVPEAGCSIDELFDFALTFDGYGKYPFEKIGQLGNDARAAWRSSGELPQALEDLRAALFFEQRRWRHFAEASGAEDAEYLRLLLEAIHSTSGGAVEDHRPISL